MKQVNPLTVLCFIAAFVLMVASCKKGDTGPAGATGPAGPTGAAGPTGGAGPAGTANVIYSDWLDAKYLPDTIHTGTLIDTVGFYFDQNVPKLTSDILTKGDIKVYFNFQTAATPLIVPLPYWDPYTSLSINPTYTLTNIDLYADANFSTQGTGAAKRGQWRYILIPGGTGARSAIDWKNYDEVKKYLNLKD